MKRKNLFLQYSDNCSRRPGFQDTGLGQFSILDHCSEEVWAAVPGSDQSQTVSQAPSDRWTLTAQTVLQAGP